MSPGTHLLFANCTDVLTSFEALLCFLLFAALLALLLTPGGPAWARVGSMTRVPIPGPSGSLTTVFSGPTPHRVLSDLAKRLKATPLMAFSVGFSRFVISSEPETAKEILNSSAFADRPVKESAYELLFHRAMGFAPYGEYWRNLRRISATNLFCPRRISTSEVVRREIGMRMVKNVKCSVSGDVEVKKVLHFGSLNNVMMTVFGKSYDFYDEEGKGGEGYVLERLVSEGYELLGVFNWSDHYPVLGWFDFQGVRKRCRALVSQVNAFVGAIIEEHRVKQSHGGDGGGDFVDVLLGLQKDEKLSDSDMIAVLWEMIFRGTDTVAILLEWILARMVIHREIQEKVHSEIASVTSNSTRPVSDSDIPNLPYLQAVVKETLRLHPPGPLLSWARLAIHDVHVGPNLVPGGTIAMVNMWAITHDPKIWADPEEFRPERFMEEDVVSVMGSDLRLAPFGSGRRVCPGKAMGLATVHLWLAQLVQNFEWVKGSWDVDLSEVLKLSMEMKKPLVCKAVPRPVHFA